MSTLAVAVVAFLVGSAVSFAVAAVFLPWHDRRALAGLPAPDRWLLSELGRISDPDGTAPVGEAADVHERYSNLLRSGHK